MRYIEIINEALNVDLTAKNFGPQLRKRLLNDNSAKRERLFQLSDVQVNTEFGNMQAYYQDIIEWFAQYDPTPAKKYLINWIIPKYLNGGINLCEDLKSVFEDLVEFDRWKHKMPIKDIFKIKNATELTQMIRNVLRAEGGAESQNGYIPPEEVKAAHDESILIFDNAEYTIVIPETQRAAGFWGRNTEWCTAYGYKYGINSERSHNAFKDYNSPTTKLLIFFNKNDGNDAQCYYGSVIEDVQIMDDDDVDCKGYRWFQTIMSLIPKDKYEIINKNCLGDYKLEDVSNTVKIKMKSLKDCVDKYGDDNLKNWARIVIDGDHWDFNDSASPLSEIIDDVLPEDIKERVEQYVRKTYPEEFDEDGYSENDISTILSDNDDELADILQSIDLRAKESGGESAMSKAFFEAIDEYVEYKDIDGPCKIDTGLSFIDFLCNPKEIEITIEMQEPYYGFSGYDTEAWDDAQLENYLNEHLSPETVPEEVS